MHGLKWTQVHKNGFMMFFSLIKLYSKGDTNVDKNISMADKSSINRLNKKMNGFFSFGCK